MKKYNEYIDNVRCIIDRIENEDADAIESAAENFAEALIKGNRIFLFGTGHSHMLSEELFYRAGGLLNVQPILIDELMLHVDAHGSTLYERKEGLAEEIYDEYKITSDDVIVIISNSGRNGVVVDMALLCKERGLTVIALTNIAHSSAGESRHGSGKRLYEIADVVLDNCGCVGDACVSVKGVAGNICATSTVSGALILNCIVAQAVDICVKNGFCPEHFFSANIDGGDEVNEKLVMKYKKEIKHL